MSLQWTLIATCLYAEIAIILIFLLPIIGPRKWRSFFDSRFIKALSNQSNIYLMILIGLLLLFFAESIREFMKYNSKINNKDHLYAGSMAFYEDQMRLFRGQRNFYISGFSLFGLFIIKRLANLISQQAQLKADAEASRRQAENLSKHVEQISSEQSSSSSSAEKKASASDSLLKEMKAQMGELLEKNEQLKKEMYALKKQAESTNKEYDRLTAKYAELQDKYDRVNQNRDR